MGVELLIGTLFGDSTGFDLGDSLPLDRSDTFPLLDSLRFTSGDLISDFPSRNVPLEGVEAPDDGGVT